MAQLFFPYTRTVGRRLVDADSNEPLDYDAEKSEGNEYPNMKQLGYCIGAYAKTGHTLLQMQASLKRGQAISPYISTQYKTAVCFDSTLGERNFFEMNLNQLAGTEAPGFFKEMLEEYTPPSELRFVWDKRELDVSFKELLDAGEIDIARFVSFDKNKGGGEGWPLHDQKRNPFTKLIYDITQRYPYYWATNSVVETSPRSQGATQDELGLGQFLANSSPGLGRPLAELYEADDTADLPPHAERPNEMHPECCYPGCNADAEVELRVCSVEGCDNHLHHLCAISAGEEALPPRCLPCFLAAGPDTAPHPGRDFQASDLLSEGPPTSGSPSEHEEEQPEIMEIDDDDAPKAAERKSPAEPSSPVSADFSMDPASPIGSQKHMVRSSTPPTPKNASAPPQHVDIADLNGAWITTEGGVRPTEDEQPQAVDAQVTTPTKGVRGNADGSPVRVSPPRPRGAQPHDPSHLYGYATGREVLQPADNSCFYHSTNALVRSDPQLSIDPTSLRYLGGSVHALRGNIGGVLSGLSSTFSPLNAKPYDFRVGAPPELDSSWLETLSDVSLSAWQLELAEYGALVRDPNHWGCEIDLQINANVTQRVWQFGTVTTDAGGEAAFLPTLQATPFGYKFDGLPPKRMVHVGTNHFNAFYANAETLVAVETPVPKPLPTPSPPNKPEPSKPPFKPPPPDDLLELLAQRQEREAEDKAQQAAARQSVDARFEAIDRMHGKVKPLSYTKLAPLLGKILPDEPLEQPDAPQFRSLVGRILPATPPKKPAAQPRAAAAKPVKADSKKYDLRAPADAELKQQLEKQSAEMAVLQKLLEKAQRQKMDANKQAQKQKALDDKSAAALRRASATFEAELVEVAEQDTRGHHLESEGSADGDDSLSSGEKGKLDEKGQLDIKLGCIVSLQFGSRKPVLGEVKKQTSKDGFLVLLDSSEEWEADLRGPRASKHTKVVPPHLVPPDMVRFRKSAATMLFGLSRAVLAEMGTIQDDVRMLAVLDSTQVFVTQSTPKHNSHTWADLSGVGQKVFSPAINDDLPKPMDIVGFFKTNSSTKTTTLTAIEVSLGYTLSFDPLCKKVMVGSESQIGARLNVFGAGKNSAVKIALPHDGREWKFGDSPNPENLDDDAEQQPELPIEVRSLAADITSVNEMRFISNSSDQDLIAQIGASAYAQLVKSVSNHPIWRQLVAENWPNMMGCNNILTALRKLADGESNAKADLVLAKHIVSTAAKSIGDPISNQYSGQHLGTKEHARAMTTYEKKVDGLFKILTPGATELAAMFPKLHRSTDIKDLFQAAKGQNTPVIEKAAKLTTDTTDTTNKTDDRPTDKTTDKTANKTTSIGKATDKSTDSSNKSADKPTSKSKKLPTATPAAGGFNKGTPPSAMLAGAVASSGPARKSALGIGGSPMKSAADDERDAAPKRVRAEEDGSAEFLAESMNLLPGITAKFEAMLNNSQSKTVSDLENRVKMLEDENKELKREKETHLRKAGEDAALLKAMSEQLMAAKVDAAQQLGEKNMLLKQLERTDTQLNSWVRAAFEKANLQLDFELSDKRGSII